MAITHIRIKINTYYIYVFYVEFSPASFNLSKLLSKFSYKKVISYFVENWLFFVKK